MKFLTTSAVLALAGAVLLSAPVRAADEKVSYKLDVQPILQARCGECHTPPNGAGYVASGLNLTTYAGLMKGTKHGPVVIPGSPLTSNLDVMIEGRASKQIQMPHGQRPLLKAQQKIIRDWVAQGAKDN